MTYNPAALWRCMISWHDMSRTILEFHTSAEKNHLRPYILHHEQITTCMLRWHLFETSRVWYHKDQYWVQFCIFFTSMRYAMCQTYLNLYYSPTTQIYSVLTPAYMTYETLSIGSWLNCLCGSRLIDYHKIWGKQITCCSAVDRLTMS